MLFGSAFTPAAASCSTGDCVLVWEDNFDGSEVNADNWEFMLGNGCSYCPEDGAGVN